MAEIKLKPCPFCGSEKTKVGSKRTFVYGGKKHCSVSIRCMKCHARGPVVGVVMPNGEDNEIELCENAAYEDWNKRAEINLEETNDNGFTESSHLPEDA